MGHASTKTTEQYYARVKNTVAIEKAQKMWAERNKPAESVEKETKVQPVQISPKPDTKGSIEPEKWVPGYA